MLRPERLERVPCSVLFRGESRQLSFAPLNLLRRRRPPSPISTPLPSPVYPTRPRPTQQRRPKVKLPRRHHRVRLRRNRFLGPSPLAGARQIASSTSTSAPRFLELPPRDCGTPSIPLRATSPFRTCPSSIRRSSKASLNPPKAATNILSLHFPSSAAAARALPLLPWSSNVPLAEKAVVRVLDYLGTGKALPLNPPRPLRNSQCLWSRSLREQQAWRTRQPQVPS